jgi:ribonuclease HI
MEKAVEESSGGQRSKEHSDTGVWKNLWALMVPNDVKLFAWRACHNILPTCVNLCRRKVLESNMCPCCQREPETTIHALWTCPTAQDVWGAKGSFFHKCNSNATSFKGLLEEMGSNLSKANVELMVVIARRIWLRRNTLVFEGVFIHPNEVYAKAGVSLKEFHRCNTQKILPPTGGVDLCPARQQRWSPPPTGLIKINWDVALNIKEGCIGMGIVARNCMGEVMGAKSVIRPIMVDPKIAEAMAALWTVLFCKEVGFIDVIIEGDATQVLDEINSPPPYLSNTGQFTESIIKEINGLHTVKFNHVHRELNGAAHALAKVAAEQKMNMEWLEKSPVCISNIIDRKMVCP